MVFLAGCLRSLNSVFAHTANASWLIAGWAFAFLMTVRFCSIFIQRPMPLACYRACL
jgi:hypothetical protein